MSNFEYYLLKKVHILWGLNQMQIEILDTNTPYAGDINPKTAWDFLSGNAQAILVDVRTKAELNFVGFPDLSKINKSALNVEQQFFPGGIINNDFVETLENNLNEMNLSKDTPILFLCRSGARSAKAATMMASNGWTRCFNIAYGFEGDPNEKHHRAYTNGWKFEGLPWIQL